MKRRINQLVNTMTSDVATPGQLIKFFITSIEEPFIGISRSCAKADSIKVIMDCDRYLKQLSKSVHRIFSSQILALQEILPDQFTGYGPIPFPFNPKIAVYRFYPATPLH